MFQSEKKLLDDFLQSQKYPFNRKQILDNAMKRSLPIQLVQILERLDDRQYTSMDDVEQVLAVHKA